MKRVLLLVFAVCFVASVLGQNAEAYRVKAEEGDAVAQYNLGVCYDNGYGVPMNKTKAVEWYQKAAEQGYAKAQCNLGSCYCEGEGVPMNRAKAVELWKKAAAQGNVRAKQVLVMIIE